MVKPVGSYRCVRLLLLAIGAAGLSGCVERRYTVRTDPPGALVIANGEAIGPSPASKSFTFYGDREFVLMLDGYETKKVLQPIQAPWWDNLLTEFFTENLVPYSLRDEREFTYTLAPVQQTPAEPLRDRGEALRNEAKVLPQPRRGGILGWLGF